MKYHKQKIMHDPKNGQFGDCFKTAIACLLDMDPGDVPHFCDGDPDRGEFEERVDRWLRERGLVRFIIGFRMEPQELMEYVAMQNPGMTYLISGKSPRHEASHVVIARDREIVHDPHPDGTGLDGVDSDGASWVEFLVSANAHRPQPQGREIEDG